MWHQFNFVNLYWLYVTFLEQSSWVSIAFFSTAAITVRLKMTAGPVELRGFKILMYLDVKPLSPH